VLQIAGVYIVNTEFEILLLLKEKVDVEGGSEIWI
jgi:hypothetical protein